MIETSDTPIYEEDDFCAKCEGTERLVWLSDMRICQRCWEDSKEFCEWFMAQMMADSEVRGYDRP